MERIALLFGALMVALGAAGALAPEAFGMGKDGKEASFSPTALIPAVFGAILIACAVIVMMHPSGRKHVMHVAAATGVLGALGGFVPVITRKGNFEEAAVVLGVLMTGLCVLFVILCVRSFLGARNARNAGVHEHEIPPNA